MKYIRIEEIKLSLNDDESLLESKIVKILWLKKEEILELKIIKKAVDSRNKRDILFIYSIDIDIKKKDTFFDNSNRLPSFIQKIDL